MLQNISELILNYSSWIAIVGALLVAIILRWYFLHHDKSWIGFWPGLVIIPIVWVFEYMVLMPSPEECQAPNNCEGAAVWVMASTLLVWGAVAIYICVAIALGLIYRRIIKSQYQDKVSYRAPILSWLSILIFSPVVGFGLGIVVINIVESGLFIPWRSISLPPLLPDEKLHQIFSARPGSVSIETSFGNTYEANIDMGWANEKYIWMKQTRPPWLDTSDTYTYIFEPCDIQFWPPPLPEKAIQHVITRTCLPFKVSHTEYAISNNGNFWLWHRGITTHNFPNYTFALVGGSLLGFLGGLVTVVACERKFVMKSR